MKRTIYLIAAILITNLSMSQTQCVWCNNNTVDSIKFASAIGSENISTGLNSFAGGSNCHVLGDYSFALGLNDTAFNECSIALGKYSAASGITAFASGYSSKAYGDYSTALGTGAQALGYRSVALGTTAVSEKINSFTFGTQVKSSANYSFVMGVGQNLNYLVNTVPYSLMIGFGSINPTFFLSPSPGTDKTGKIGIGNITEPEAKLHIKADDDEDASLFLQPTGTGYFGKLMVGDESHTIKAKSGENLEFKTETGKNFVFKNGSIFIEDSFSGLILKSPDGQCWKGTIDDNGSFAFESIDCNLITGENKFPVAQHQTARVFPNPAGNKLYIEIPADMQQAFVALYNEQGILLYRKELHGGKNPVSLRKMPRGVLVVKVFNGAGELLSTEKVLHA
ncbi:MAG: hypothetical protein K8R37_16305 [Bacteroidales bacterium]|nr:hypothetical protein [Bacteroidales bacterium]